MFQYITGLNLRCLESEMEGREKYLVLKFETFTVFIEIGPRHAVCRLAKATKCLLKLNQPTRP